MKYMFMACGLLLGSLLQAQDPSGGDRICGTAYSGTPLYGLSYREAFEKTAAWYTAYQDYLFSRLAAEPPDFGDIRSLTKKAQEISEHFFTGQGYEAAGRLHPFGIGEAAILQWQYGSAGSPTEEAREVLQRLTARLYRYHPEAHTRFVKEILELQEQALLLKEETDVFTAGVPVRIALAALQYWHLQGDKWMQILGKPSLVLQEKGISGTSASVQENHCRSSTRHLGVAAACGAVRGITEGDIPGSAAGWSEAVLRGCSASAGNFFNQVIHCGIDWWPY